jgi:splicing factor 3A subunit 3
VSGRPQWIVNALAECAPAIALLFSGEEGYGRFLDLYSNHTAYNNIKNIGRRLGYLQYIDALLVAESGPLHSELSSEVRSSKDYETCVNQYLFPLKSIDAFGSYIKALHNYLLEFTKRTQPLVDVDAHQKAAESDFDSKWAEGAVPGWEDVASSAAPVANGGTGIWCSACMSSRAYKTFRLILNTGEKMYSKQTVYDAHLTSKKHVKATAKQAASASGPPANPNGPPDGTVPTTTAPSAPAKHRTAALLTSLSAALLVTLVPALNDTKANVERRFSLTAREREQELIEQQQRKVAPATTKTDGAEGEGEDDEEERIYNPLKLPLGWDGKPIPYWLYKLHGLGVEYRCEICSDHVYMGRLVHDTIRKNFERHFQESRHAFGMRALGLPNTKHFHEIIKIADALACESLKPSTQL